MISGWAQRLALCGALACTLPSWSPPAFALNPALDVDQYAHTAWRIRDGFSKGVTSAFAQTPDGYLWLGTEFGLLRFDGVRIVQWQPPAGMALADERVRALLAARDGTLWIATLGGLASWNGIKLIQYPQFDATYVNALVEDREGTVWVGATFRSRDAALLCAIRRASTECRGQDGSLGPGIAALYEDLHGVLWVAARNALWRWKPGPPIAYPVQASSLRALSETATGDIVIVTRNGVRQLVDGKIEEFPMTPRLVAGELLRDHDGALWFGTRDSGLRHVHEGRVDAFGQAEGLSGDAVDGLFEDREGNVWVATTDGVDRFRPLATATYSARQNVAGNPASVLADRDGSIWVSTSAGLYRLHEARLTVDPDRHGRAIAAADLTETQRPMVDQILAARPSQPAPASLFQDAQGRIWIGALTGLGYLERGRFIGLSSVPPGYIDSFAEDRDGNLWIAHRDAGLMQLSSGRVMHRFPWTSISESGPAMRLAFDSVHGGVWLGFVSGGVAHFVDAQVRESYSVRDGLGKGRIGQLSVGVDGTLWVATEGGLSRIKDGRIATLDRRSGLPCDPVQSVIQDDDGASWIRTACGMVRIAGSDLDAWAAAADHGDALPSVHVTVLDSSDGVRSTAVPGTFSPYTTKSRDGKLWLATRSAAEVIDTRHLPSNKLPPPVHIEQVTADRKTYEGLPGLHLPALTHDLEIDYTALSLVAPEKNLFRYKLEGRDRDWQSVGNRRQALYSDLPPGNYRFRVVASNNSGVWNEQGAVLDFSIAPAYWQTTWFRAACVVSLLFVLWALYQLRLRQLARQFNMTLDARVAERTRIARELHDTLLQSFHGLLLRFQTASNLLSTRPAEAKQTLDGAIDQAAQAITEGREAVQGLRASVVESNDLAVAIRTFGQELAAEQVGSRSVVLHVVVEGTPRALHPIQRDEIYRIACEALRNAFKHASPTRIEVELRYDERQLRLRVRDDGTGIDPQFLTEEGRAGHYGLHGMRERGKLMGGKLTVWSAPDSGAEVELSVPAARAYATSSPTWRSWFGKKYSGESTESES